MLIAFTRFRANKMLSAAPTRNLVAAGSKFLNVYETGAGLKTLVFLAGGGTPMPVYDFKPLYDKLSDKYHIVVVEKSGYGFSDHSHDSRDLNQILFETRSALKAAKIKGPYFLMPHSMSGIEALYWAQLYPDEVAGIIGLDMASPEAYEKLKLPSQHLIKMLAFLRKIGLAPLIAGRAPAMASGNLSKEDRKLFRALFDRNWMSTDVRNEIKTVKNNAEIVAANPLPQVPLLLLVSNGQGTGFTARSWLKLQQNLQSKRIIQFDAPHYLYHYETAAIAQEIDNFLSSVGKES
ncbi:alpha/beta fold hydrolase [Xylocopilactobacillus apicola]|uniref:Alpha/beta hydrolase n=1 Tax=Xylocopilactobacillus apicola TaxID=2932184 RepID=A0AAU9DXQ5_9LACO|nr:alpha/beta hydrolase [Xylocopilactobacillus apicola]BDR58908.1 alpha/beta hydrolase [Xylocopilactobacillus apicola]